MISRKAGTGIKDELKTTIRTLTKQTTSRLVEDTESTPDERDQTVPEIEQQTVSKRQKKEPEWFAQMEQSVIPLRYPRLRQKLDSLYSSGRVTISIVSLMDTLNCSKKFIHYRIKSGALQVATHNNNLVRIDSVIDWLQTADIPTKDEHSRSKTEERIPEIDKVPALTSEQNDVPEDKTIPQTHTILHVQESDKLSITLAAMRINPDITDEELMPLLGMRRPASCTFWRLKAQTLLDEEKRNGHNGHSKETTVPNEYPEILV